MNCEMHTHDYAGNVSASARTSHQYKETTGLDVAIIRFITPQGEMLIYGPGSARDAFDQIAALFNGAHQPMPLHAPDEALDN